MSEDLDRIKSDISNFIKNKSGQDHIRFSDLGHEITSLYSMIERLASELEKISQREIR